MILAAYGAGTICLALACGAAVGMFCGYLFGSAPRGAHWLPVFVLIGIVLCLPGWALL